METAEIAPSVRKLEFTEDNLPDDNRSIKVLVHATYGTEGLPSWLLKAYADKRQTSVRELCDFHKLRYDPLCLQLMREFAISGIPHEPKEYARRTPAFSPPRGDKWRAVRIPVSCLDSFVITEYDGLESLHIDTGCVLIGILKATNDESSRKTLEALDAVMAECRTIGNQMSPRGIE